MFMVDVANSKARSEMRLSAEDQAIVQLHADLAVRRLWIAWRCAREIVSEYDQRFDDLAELINQPIGEETDA